AAISITFVKQNIFLPNAISLNASNSENAIFYPKGNGATTYTLQIFDRWGNIVFNQSDGRVGDPSSGWHPNPRLEEGVYVYVLNILNGLQSIVKYGDVLLLK
ncbi:MAG: gliding motility-associated C-terminal domain-containing protein, partial [Saprospiraceae bacterium]|nr:gliding motility-associated C-terminal domain-containing protein [Saprospiraceae bacterium]